MDLQLLKVFVDDIMVRLRAHTALANAHHEPYTDAEVNALIAVHTAISGAHHARYTDAEAVSAVNTADNFVENVGDTITGTLFMDNADIIINDGYVGSAAGYKVTTYRSRDGGISLVGDRSTTAQVLFRTAISSKLGVQIKGTVKSVQDTYVGVDFGFYFYDNAGALRHFIGTADGCLEINNLILKNPKNHADATLSGTPKIIETKIGSTSYYHKVYPTKT